MKIKKVSCTQFAGARDLDVSFSDGINVVYGKNESGKSTLVNLISRTLFQNAKLDRRTDRNFINLFFPSVPAGVNVPNFIDGKISIETKDGTYTLTKWWEIDTHSCTLSTPNGVVSGKGNQAQVDEILREVLVYGEGVYSEMLFSSQYNTDLSLQTLLDASSNSNAKQEITKVLTMAFAGSGGISVDSIETAIKAKIDEIADEHWDKASCMPQRRNNGERWSKSIGEIHKAYYMLEDAKAELKKITDLEYAADCAVTDYEAKNAAALTAEQKYREFEEYAGQLIVLSAQKEKLDRAKADIAKFTEVLNLWPKYQNRLKRTRALQAEKQSRELLDKYSAVKLIAEKLNALKDLQSKQLCPDAREIREVKTALRSIDALESRLRGMNLAATIKMLGGNSVEVKSLRNGRIIEVDEGNISITEAVKITVPNVMEMQLAPANVNVSEVEAQLIAQRQAVSSTFKKYGVDSAEELEGLASGYAETQRDINVTESKLAVLLGNTPFEELKIASEAIPSTVRSMDQIDLEIAAVCKGMEISRLIARDEAVLDGYAMEYVDTETLNRRLSKANADCIIAQNAVDGAQNIPVEYLAISNPENHRIRLQTYLELKKRDREQALEAKTKANTALESYKENLDGDPAANVSIAEQAFNEQKALLNHWLHIYKVFQIQKQALSNNPMHDISASFTKYLGVITGGTVRSEFPDENRLDINILSNNRSLDYEKLSEGTKETVSLAFRLAVLDHLFPDGGGVVIFDDPFTDMDDERTATACRLLKECATRHQVIFLTCKRQYVDVFGVKEVEIG